MTTGSTGSALRLTVTPTVAGTAPAARRAAPAAPPRPLTTTTTPAATVRSRGDGCSGSPTRSSRTMRAKGAGRDRRTNRSPAHPHQLPREGRTEPPRWAPITRGRRGARTTAPNPRDPTTRQTTAIRRSFCIKAVFSDNSREFLSMSQFLCEYNAVPLPFFSPAMLFFFFLKIEPGAVKGENGFLC